MNWNLRHFYTMTDAICYEDGKEKHVIAISKKNYHSEMWTLVSKVIWGRPKMYEKQ